MSAEPATVRPPDIHAHRILILDFGSQYTQLIARRVRELGVYCEIHPWDMGDADGAWPSAPAASSCRAVLSRVTHAGAPAAPAAVFELGVPVLGICYGMQTMARSSAAASSPAPSRIRLCRGARSRHTRRCCATSRTASTPRAHGLLDVWMSHGDRVVELPPGFKVRSPPRPTCRSRAWPTRYAGSTRCSSTPRSRTRRQGARIYERFLHGSAAAIRSWNAGNIIEDAVARVREQVGGGKVLLGLSGGVDSSVVAALLHKAIGDQLTCVFVDHGLLRHHEGDQVMAVFARNLGVRVIRVDAAERFFAALRGRRGPRGQAQDHRSPVHRGLRRRGAQARGREFLAQGTIYPDVIESAGSKTGKAHVIKIAPQRRWPARDT